MIEVTVTGHIQQAERLDGVIWFLRAGDLGRAFSRGAVQRGRKYDQFVQSAQQQASIHRGWWHTDLDVAQETESEISGMVEKTVQRLAETNSRQVARNFVTQMLQLWKKRLETYPPVRPNSTYVRTYTLHRSYATETLL